MTPLRAGFEQTSTDSRKGGGYPALGLMLMLWSLIEDLTDREILILWADSAMDRAMRKLRPMCEHGFRSQQDTATARAQAHELLGRLQADGLYL